MIVQHPTLYKRTKSGKIQIWYMETEGNAHRAVSGQQDGKKVTSEWTYAEAKNVGRANATTPEEQALLEVESNYTKRLEGEYRRDISEIDVMTRFLPMLATKWGDLKDKITETHVHIQPKLDGMRCIAMASGCWTRNGKEWMTVPHIKEALAPLFAENPGLVLDGELYNHQFHDDFNKISSLAKKTKPTVFDLAESAELIEYHVYDVASMSSDFSIRHEWIEQNLPNHPALIKVETRLISISEVDEVSADFIEQGYEGSMVRLPGKYENRRSKTLIKWKEFQDREWIITKIEEGRGNRAGMAARVFGVTDEGNEFSSGVIGNVPYCKWLLENKDQFIGKPGTFVFQNLTPDGIPRFTKFKTVRAEGY